MAKLISCYKLDIDIFLFFFFSHNSNTSNSNTISSALNSSSANAFGSNTNLSTSISSSKTPNAPGPPQIDGKVCKQKPYIFYLLFPLNLNNNTEILYMKNWPKSFNPFRNEKKNFYKKKT